MKGRDWLVDKYGEGVADGIIASKKTMQASKKPWEPDYVMDNPDIPASEDTCPCEFMFKMDVDYNNIYIYTLEVQGTILKLYIYSPY